MPDTVLSATVYSDVLTAILRYLVPALSFLILCRCAKTLFLKQKPAVWGWLHRENGEKLPLTHWETVIGSSKRSDICIFGAGVAKDHAILTRTDDGNWCIAAVGRAEMKHNGQKTTKAALQDDDTISISMETLRFAPVAAVEEKQVQAPLSPSDGVLTLILLTVLQLLCCLSYCLVSPNPDYVLVGFGGLVFCQWGMRFVYFYRHKSYFDLETVAFFLSTLGMCAICAVCPEEAGKQVTAMLLGIGLFFGITRCLRHLELAKKVRPWAAVAGIAFLVLTLIFGREFYGAKNWILIGDTSIQPSELSKVCFVFAGACGMDRLMDKKNILSLILYAVMICLCLALMNDLGTALIFFVSFLVIAYLRSGSVGTVALACTSAGFAGVVLLRIAPHALRRFTAWRHIWENPLTSGFQQTRALMCMASGGFLGLGAGRGAMKNYFAADSDVVIATLCEEWGFLTVLLLILSVVVLAVFAVRSAAAARSSFYAIGAVTAASIMVFQTMLNTLGTMDILPLTGVTFPFVSNGGSSMVCLWGLLAFIKAADTRQGGKTDG